MTRTVKALRSILLAVAAISLLAACPNPWLPWLPQASPTPSPGASATPAPSPSAEATPTPTAEGLVIPPPLPNPTPIPGGDMVFIEDAEDALSAAVWTLFSDRSDALAVIDTSDAWSGASSIKINSRPLLGTLGAPKVSYISFSLNLAEPANLRFRYRTDIGTDVATTLRLYRDGSIMAELNGLGMPWRIYDLPLSAGAHTIRLSVEKESTSYYPSFTNSVWLDDITICRDAAHSVDMEPDGDKLAVMGGEPLVFSATVLRQDGSAMEGLSPPYSVIAGTGNGSVDGAGTLTPTAAGSLSVRASYGAFSADSGEVTVLAADWKSGPLEYRGTVYAGKAGGGSGSSLYAADPNVVVTSPAEANFQADAYFSLSGSVSWTDPAKQYALVRITKGDYAENVLVRGNYTERIWLRDGAGIYAVNVYRCTLTVNNLDYEGDTNSLSWSGPVYAFTVENTRQESGIYRYPSGAIQADHPAIFNLATELIHGIEDPYWRLRAIRDEVAFRLSYDMASTYPDQRKKQDALSCLESGLAVCEGYTSLYAALTRAMGFSVMAACGDAGGGHAWNLVDYQSAYRMVDVTWDDMDELGISDTYFLCDPSGVEADHSLEDTRPERNVAVDLRTLP